MQEVPTDLITETVLELNIKRRKQLLPWWIKVFMWLFLVMSALIPVVLGMGIFGANATLALYGLETNEPLSITGITITTLFLIKGITSFGLLTEKDWAIKIGMIDAITGILICFLLMAYSLINASNFSFRLEVLLLIPYLLKLMKIKPDWENYSIVTIG